DQISLNRIDAKTGVAGNQAFKWIGTHDFHNVKGELRYIDKGATCIVQADVNGDGKADFEILVKVDALLKGDFIL
ncbi:MAG: matrixin, partial [Hyphomicrobiales bacterium]